MKRALILLTALSLPAFANEGEKPTGFDGAFKKIEMFFTRTDEGRPKLGFISSIGLPLQYYVELAAGYHIIESVRLRAGVAFVGDDPPFETGAVSFGAQYSPLPRLWISPVVGLHYARALGARPFEAKPFVFSPATYSRDNVSASFGIDLIPYRELNISGGYQASLTNGYLSGVYLELGYFFDTEGL